MNDEQVAKMVDAALDQMIEGTVKRLAQRLVEELAIQIDCELTMRQVAAVYGEAPLPD